MKALEDEFEKIEAKQREWLDMGFSIDSAPLKELDKQMDGIWADIDRLQRKQKEMQATGRAYVDPTSTDAYKDTAENHLCGNVCSTSVPELHQWLRACKRENARKKSQGHNGTKKQTKDLHI